MGLTKNLGWLSKYITADSSGLIGIGTVPSYGLDIQGASAASAYLNITKTGYASAFLQAYDNGVYIGSSNGYPLVLTTNNTERIRITTDGNIGLGTAIPSRKVETIGGNGGGFNVVGNNGVTNNTTNGLGFNTGYGVSYIQSKNTSGADADLYIGASKFILNSGNVLIGTTTDSGAKLQVNGTVSASGRLSLGDGVVSNFNAISISSGVYTSTAAISIGASNPTGGVVSPIITFTAPNASYSYAVRGGMYYNGSNLQMEFRTTSDYRVKEDLIEDFNAIDLLDKIKIYDHKWIGASGRSYSVIAHELQNVIPYLVSGQKDAILEDGGMDLQSVDYSKLVPILIKGIQELTERIKTLENK